MINIYIYEIYYIYFNLRWNMTLTGFMRDHTGAISFWSDFSWWKLNGSWAVFHVFDRSHSPLWYPEEPLQTPREKQSGFLYKRF